MHGVMKRSPGVAAGAFSFRLCRISLNEYEVCERGLGVRGRIRYGDSHHISAIPYPIRGQTKEGRLQAVAALIELGTILFPEKGAEPLIEQILGFGTEKHDDLVDAFTILILQLLESTKQYPQIQWVHF